MKNTILFVPGIMGTKLVDVKNDRELWGENIISSFRNLASNAGLMKLAPEWMRTDAVKPECVLERVQVMRIPVARMYRKLFARIRRLSSPTQCDFVPFPYDWRRDMETVANQLSLTVKEIAARGVDPEHRFTLIGHSMGCLVIAIALLTKGVPVESVNSVVFVAPPFLGSPSAFIALYDSGYLPGFDFVERFLGLRRDRLSRISNMLEASQTFTSLYQLLPHESDRFLTLPKGNTINPLSNEDDVVTGATKQSANRIHSTISGLPAFLISNSIQHVIICGITNRRTMQLKFDQLPEARHKLKQNFPLTTASNLSATYGVNLAQKKVYTSVSVESLTEGDGTVPVASGRFDGVSVQNDLNIRHIEGVKHTSICEDDRVIDLVVQYLPFVSKKAAKV
jgi:hypothetical protein